ncbi:MAG: SpoIIE family protein phosphatase [Bacteroidales bacterium]|nr:SpoIIE family protein phosphatase [Bacteroidales bacterium]
MFYRLFILMTLVILHYGGLQCYSQQYQFNHFGISEGLSQPFIYTINQDEQGFLWIGTSEGLFRFNGFQFKHFTSEDSLAGNFVTESLKDKNGNLWFGHMNGSITLYNGNSFIKFEADSFQNTITGISEGKKGNIWCSTQTEGLFRIDQQQKIHHINLPFEQELISELSYLNDGYLLIGTDQQLCLLRYNPNGDGMVMKGKIDGFPEGNVTDIIGSYGEDQLFAISEGQGIFLLNKKKSSFQFKASRIDSLGEEYLNNIQGGIIDKEGNIWMNSMGSGVFRLSPEKPDKKNLHLNNANGLPTNDVRCLFEDREGNIWFGLYGEGLVRFVEEKLLFYSYTEQFETNSFYSLDGKQNHLWTGSNHGILHLDTDNGNVLDVYSTGDGLPNDKITALFKHPGGDIWIGTEKSGLYKLNHPSEQIQRIPISSNELENSVNYITGDQKNIWVATKKGICHINLNNGGETWYNTNKGLPYNNITHLYKDSENRILIGTLSNQLFAINQEGRVETIPIHTAQGPVQINSITEDNTGNIWIGTYGKGIFKIGQDTTKHFDRETGLLSNYSYSLVYANENILVGHHGGLSEINTKTNGIKLYSGNYGIKNSTEFFNNAVYTETESNIWFGTSEGIAEFSAAKTAKDTIPPQLNITEIFVNNQKVDADNNITLEPGNYELEFNYIGIRLHDPESVKYQYKLKGYTKGWEEFTSERKATFGNVRPGEYTFRLRAFNKDGASTGKPLEVNILIRKHIYQRAWFYVVFGIALLGLGYLIIVIRERNLVHEKRKLEKKVRERTEELHKTNNELALRNKNITSSMEYAKSIQAAILPSQIPFDNVMIFFRPKEIVSGDFYWFTNFEGLQYMAAVDCTGHGIPGAFMSFIGHISLKKILIEHKIKKPAEILYHLNVEVARTLNQKENDSIKNGMDIGLACYNPDSGELQYAGDFIPLWLIRNNKLYEYKPNRFSIGYSIEKIPNFTNYNIKIEKGDSIYMMSDGFVSQFGGEEGKKFKTRHLKNLICSIGNYTISEQHKILGGTLDEWMAGYEQVDDILIIGRSF